jgi:hypothetical protein
VGDSDRVPTRPTKAPPRSRPIADFGFTGTFVSEDTVLAGSLEVKKNKVTLWASGTQLASWKSSDCRVQRLDGDQFSIEADGEMITFTADDPEGLIDAVSAFLSAGTVITDLPAMTTPAPKVARTTSDTTVSEVAAKSSTARSTESVARNDRPVKSISETPITEKATRAEDSLIARVKAEPTTPIRKPRIKSFEADSGQSSEGSRSKAAALASYTVGAAAPPKETATAKKATAAPVVDDETDDGTMADRITATAKRKYRSTKAHRWLKSDIEDVAIKTGVVASAAGILTLFALTIFVLAGGFRGEPEFVPVPTTTIPPAPTTTVVVTTIPPPPTTLFETDPLELTARWNALAERSRPELTLFTDLTSPFLLTLTPYLTFEGLLDPVSGFVVLRSTPTGTPDGDGLILTSLGLLIGMSDTTLDGSDRRVLLETLGLTIQDPQLGGIDGTVIYNGLTYRLVYLADQGVLEFRISPEVPSDTTTTTTAP